MNNLFLAVKGNLSYSLLSSFIGGFLAIIALFLFCAFCVVGIKIIYITLLNASTPTPPPKKKQVRKKKTVKSFNSIEIDPENIDRIYVKKSS